MIFSVMSALVYWCDTKHFSVVPVSDIITLNGQPPEVGTVYQIRWLKKFYAGRVLRLAEKSSDFDQVSVTEDGVVLDFPTNDSLSIEAPTRKRRQEERLRRSEAAAGRLTVDFPVDGSLYTSPHELVQNAADMITSIDSPCCKKACIEVLDKVMSYAAELRRQLLEDHDIAHVDLSEVVTTPCASSVDNGKVELTTGSGVYISRHDKVAIAKAYKDNGNEMVRQLAKAILGNSIKDMSARGTGGSRGIPQEVIQSIQVFVAKHANKDIPNKAMTKILNNMITGMRHPHKKSKRRCAEANTSAAESNDDTVQTDRTDRTDPVDELVRTEDTPPPDPSIPHSPDPSLHFMTCRDADMNTQDSFFNK